mmetsp:Transcript_19588/g.16170  ORF Transcript_19588/g.16170 Transcript_19588/m.16170 type:complete len:167 (+) Transcript_19588:1024-1524(+)
MVEHPASHLQHQEAIRSNSLAPLVGGRMAMLELPVCKAWEGREKEQVVKHPLRLWSEIRIVARAAALLAVLYLARRISWPCSPSSEPYLQVACEVHLRCSRVKSAGILVCHRREVMPCPCNHGHVIIFCMHCPRSTQCLHFFAVHTPIYLMTAGWQFVFADISDQS